jgi:uncharacterized protein YecE (DUF72 family)
MWLRIGSSSWTAKSWWGRFYPSDVRNEDRLCYYARIYNTVEVDSSYYRDPGRERILRWASQTSDDFVFSLKVPREFLDPQKSPNPQRWESFHRTVRLLGAKLGPLLLQFPPSFGPARGIRFLESLDPSWDPGIRYALELRNSRWFRGEPWEWLQDCLKTRNISLVWSYLTYMDVPAEVTANFLYLRFIGDHITIPEDQHGEVRVDRREALRLWIERLRSVAAPVSETFVYFNNHFAGFAPASINHFRQLFGLEPVSYGPGGPSSSPPAIQRRLDVG